MSEKENVNKERVEVKGHGVHGDEHGKDMVTIYVNEMAVQNHRGHQTVAEIKAAGNVPSTDILYLMPNYDVALKDNDSITINGEEKFKSCAPSGGSS